MNTNGEDFCVLHPNIFLTGKALSLSYGTALTTDFLSLHLVLSTGGTREVSS